MRFQAAIFDMDGVLVDSEIRWHEVEADLWGKLGITVTDDLRAALLGKKLGDILPYVKERYGGQWSIAEARELYIRAGIPIYSRHCQLLSGARELVEKLRRVVPLALASSSPFEWIDVLLQRFQWKEVFERRYSTESMNLPGKPDSTIYHLAIESLKLKPEEVVIFEDSPRGFQAAHASGAAVVAVPDPRWSHGDFSSADFVAHTLADPNLISFLRL